MGLLDEKQIQRAKEIMEEYLSAPAMQQSGLTPVERNREWDKERVRVIENDLKPLLAEDFEGKVPLTEFKSKIDSINKRNQLWGFKGIKGQMFFNMVLNVADDLEECDQELKGALVEPESEQTASSRIKTFENYIKRIGNQWVEAGNTRYGCPKTGSIPFFLSYFWQVQNYKKWPIYYTNSVQTMNDLNLWGPAGNLADDYLSFKKIHEELAVLFAEVSEQPFDPYEVEHVFWFKGGNPYETAKTGEQDKDTGDSKPIDNKIIPESELKLLPNSYVPPIVAILPQMALNTSNLQDAAKRSGTSLDRAFEKNINAVFTIFGYEAKLLGQGKGRVPDGIAIAVDDNYAILWDAKIRTNGYSMGTDDRTIREYITSQSRELKKRRFLRNVYYVIISSSFIDDYDDTIRFIKMETDVNEVILAEADALVAMVDAKLRAPLEITLGPDGLQRLFSVSCILNAQMIREQLI